MALWDSYPLNPGRVLIVPRYPGDLPDPRGDVRWIIPERPRYWHTP